MTAPRDAAKLPNVLRARVAAVALLAAASVLGAPACSLKLGSEPFACSDGKTCPSGFTCESTVCVAANATTGPVRPLRVTYINSAEMYWFASTKGGATLVINDGFSPGARGIYEMHVTDAGEVSNPVELLSFDDEQTVSSAVVAIDDTHYGVMTASFPNALADQITVALHSLPREATATPTDDVIYSEDRPYLGGSEPAYIGAVARGDDIVYAFTDPTAGGTAVVTTLSKTGTFVSSFSVPLPDGVLPLSGDCLVWKTTDDRVMLRVGLNVMRVFSLDVDQKLAVQTAPVDGSPLYGFGDAIAWLQANDDSSQATYVVRDLAGNQLGTTPVGAFQPGIEPYTGVPYGTGALIAPLAAADDPDFNTLDVALFTPGGAVTTVASFARPEGDGLYSARPFATNGHVYLAWTSFHQSLMDLWVGVTKSDATP